jgi:hypothetical protein
MTAQATVADGRAIENVMRPIISIEESKPGARKLARRRVVGVSRRRGSWLVAGVGLPRDNSVRFPDRSGFVAGSFQAFVGDFGPKLLQRPRCRLVRMSFGVVLSPRHLGGSHKWLAFRTLHRAQTPPRQQLRLQKTPLSASPARNRGEHRRITITLTAAVNLLYVIMKSIFSAASRRTNRARISRDAWARRCAKNVLDLYGSFWCQVVSFGQSRP